MTTPEQNDSDTNDDDRPLEVPPPVSPAYGTPPPDGIPDADG